MTTTKTMRAMDTDDFNAFAGASRESFIGETKLALTSRGQKVDATIIVDPGTSKDSNEVEMQVFWYEDTEEGWGWWARRSFPCQDHEVEMFAIAVGLANGMLSLEEVSVFALEAMGFEVRRS